MTFYADNETGMEPVFDWKMIAEKVIIYALEYMKFPYEAQVNLILTGSEEIRILNKDARDKDQVTDVLSFPNIYFSEAGIFDDIDENDFSNFDPDSGELILGDIVICLDKVLEQAESYGHSNEREYAFLIAHSMLHLMGFDHETEQESETMEKLQNTILNALDFKREGL